MALQARYFRTPAELRRWLRSHHADEHELLVGFYKKGSGTAGITYPEALEEALCFGWIDGLTRRVDDERYAIRFSPRTATSTWSTVNIARVHRLIEEGRMQRAGLEAFERREKRAGSSPSRGKIKPAS